MPVTAFPSGLDEVGQLHAMSVRAVSFIPLVVCSVLLFVEVVSRGAVPPEIGNVVVGRNAVIMAGDFSFWTWLSKRF